ncbi:MAG: hypothetical protein AAGB29_04495 [Planctomycetota bacterium]
MYAAPTTPELWDAWHAAAGDAEVVGAIDAVHARIAKAVDDRRPRCDQSGRCCRFGDYGHDLFLTGLEIAVFLRRVEANPPIAPPPSDGRIALPQWSDDRVCPYMVDRGCSMHEVRPSGCRVFFCEPGTEDWQQSLYEEVLGELRRIHDKHGLPYRYMEWLDGLAAARSRV